MRNDVLTRMENFDFSPVILTAKSGPTTQDFNLKADVLPPRAAQSWQRIKRFACVINGIAATHIVSGKYCTKSLNTF